MLRTVRRKGRVRELDGVRVELTEGNAVNVDGRVLLVLVDREGDRVGARGEFHVDADVLAPVRIALRLVERDVLQELLLPGLTHAEDHLVVGGIAVLPGVARCKGKRATLTGVDGEGDGGAAREVVNPIGAVVLTQAPVVLDGVRVVAVVSRVRHRVGE